MTSTSQILIVDDDETLCYLLKEELLNEGFKVDITYDGKFAIQNLKNKIVVSKLLSIAAIQIKRQMRSEHFI